MEASSDSPLSTISKRLRLDNSLLWAAAFAFYLALRALVIANFNTSSALTICPREAPHQYYWVH